MKIEVPSERARREIRNGTKSQLSKIDKALELLAEIDSGADALLRRTSPPPPALWVSTEGENNDRPA